MKSRFLTYAIVLGCFVYNPLAAQLSEGGKPLSFSDEKIRQKPFKTQYYDKPDVASLEAEDERNKEKALPYRFGYTHYTRINTSNSGEWSSVTGGRIWQLAIVCKEAYSINLVFGRYKVPEGAKLFLYTADKSMVLGAFTSANNHESGKLGVQPLKGDSMVLEYFEPDNAGFKGELEIERVIHGYKKIFAGRRNEAFEYGNSASCEINVNCSQGAAWTNQRQSVIMVVEGGALCSGSLLNNTKKDGRPYILTANHCFDNDVASWVFVFNFQSPDCTDAEGDSTQTISGSVLRARGEDSDFLLVEMSSPPPVFYNAYYAGWSNAYVSPKSGTGIHHPEGDIKKICGRNGAFSLSYWSNPAILNHWYTPGWNYGTNQPGSSGSPLFNQNQQVVGQLHGGSATACPGTSKTSFYGGFYYSWNTGTTPSTRLKDWLDPINRNSDTLNGAYIQEAACSGTPVAGTALSSDSIVCKIQTFILSTSGSTYATGLSYQWQSSANGSAWQNISGATTAQYSTTQSAATYYRCKFTCGQFSSYSTPVQVLQSNALCYCTVDLGGGDCDLGTLAISGTTFSTSASNCAPEGISPANYYSSVAPAYGTTATLIKGKNYAVSVICSTGYSVSLWIDFNKNDSFDSNEWFGLNSSGDTVYTGTITIPSGADTGLTGMRIRSRISSNSNDSTDACTQFGSGETRDYRITLINQQACSTPVAAGNTVSSVVQPCIGQSFVLSLTGASLASGITYQWQSSSNNSNWSNIRGATSSIYDTIQSIATYYRCVLTCSGISSPSLSVYVGDPTYCYCNSNLGGYNCNIGDVTIAGTAFNTSYSNCLANPYYTQVPDSGSNTTTLIMGNNYTFSVVCSANYTISVWIDFNQNGTFDSNEWTPLSASGGTVYSGIVSIPIAALTGITGMRIRSRVAGNSNDSTDACTQFGSGETRDYLVTLSRVTAIKEAEIKLSSQNLKIVPNPNNGQFFIQLTGLNTTPVTLEIDNLLGENLYKTVSVSGNSSNSIEYIGPTLSKGVYLLKASDYSGKKVLRFVVE